MHTKSELQELCIEYFPRFSSLDVNDSAGMISRCVKEHFERHFNVCVSTENSLGLSGKTSLPAAFIDPHYYCLLTNYQKENK